MPTYPYACTACDNRFEVVQAFTDDTLTTCDECGGRLRKVFSSVGVVFKGAGFYRNDSRSTGKSEGGSSSDGGSSDGAKPDSPATSEPGTSAPAASAPAKELAGKGSGAGSGTSDTSSPAGSTKQKRSPAAPAPKGSSSAA